MSRPRNPRPLDSTAYVVKASIGIALGANAALDLGYSGEIANDREQHEANLGVRVVW